MLEFSGQDLSAVKLEPGIFDVEATGPHYQRAVRKLAVGGKSATLWLSLVRIPVLHHPEVPAWARGPVRTLRGQLTSILDPEGRRRVRLYPISNASGEAILDATIDENGGFEFYRKVRWGIHLLVLFEARKIDGRRIMYHPVRSISLRIPGLGPILTSDTDIELELE